MENNTAIGNNKFYIDEIQGLIKQYLRNQITIGKLTEILNYKLAAQPKQEAIEPHPEDFCKLCGNPNTVWYADNELFNKVNGSPNGIICPRCFHDKAEKMGINLMFKAEYVNQKPESIQGDAVEQNDWISVETDLPKLDGNSQIYCLVVDTYHGIVVRPSLPLPPTKQKQ